MSATRSKFLPSFSEDLRLVDAFAPTACFLSFAFGFFVKCLIVFALVLMPLSAEPVSKTHKHFQNNTPDASQRCAPTGVFPLPKFLLPTPVPKPVAERPPRVDRYWPERRMVVARELGEPHRWVREQEKEAWRFVNSIGK